MVVDPVIPQVARRSTGRRGAGREARKRRLQLCRLGYSPTAVTLNGKALGFDREANPYRAGGVEVSMAAVQEFLAGSANVLEIGLR